VVHILILHQIVIEINYSLIKMLTNKFIKILKLVEDISTNIVLLNNFRYSKDKSCSKRVKRKWGFNKDIK